MLADIHQIRGKNDRNFSLGNFRKHGNCSLDNSRLDVYLRSKVVEEGGDSMTEEVQCFLCLEVINEEDAGDLYGRIVCLASDECGKRMTKLYIPKYYYPGKKKKNG